ncbi:MAG: GAF domain-containing protein [Bacteroidota bacterium]
MAAAPHHPKEAERLDALRRYRILDTAPERAFDDLTYLASFFCKTPMALVTFVDRDRQWFKSRVGFMHPQTSRGLSFCAHTILQSTVMVVPDMTADGRFRENALVTHDPGIRFYAGAPIFSVEGLPLGALCVLDREPRTLTVGQEEALRAMSRLAGALLETRRSVSELAMAMDSMNLLSQMLPVCSSCRRLQNEKGEWVSLEHYVRDHAHQAGGHGTCSDCARRLYPDYIRS